MKLEDQVVSLELAKKMKELGFEQESLWYWVMWSTEQGGNGNRFLLSHAVYHSDIGDYIFPVSAYTVAELGEMLPLKYVSGKGLYAGEFWCGDFDKEPNNDEDKVDKSEANARAKMLIYLKENNL